MEAYHAYLQSLDRSPHTIRGYLQSIQVFAKWFESQYKTTFTAQEITSASIRTYRSMMQKELRRSPATINHHLAAIRSFCAYAILTGEITHTPCENIHSLREQQLSPRWLENRDQNRLLRELDVLKNGAKTEALKIQAIRDRAMVLLMLKTGIRVGELVSLKLEDVYLGQRQGEITIRQGKGNKFRRIPLNYDVRISINDWLNVRSTETTTATLFLNKQNGAITTNGVERRITQYSQRVGVKITPHMLRHTFAKNALDRGADITQVAVLLGHENLNTTRRYLTPGQEDLKKVVETL